MRFCWDERKARENKRKHGISFTLAQNALESGRAFYAGDQLEDDEWRMVMLAPVRGVLVLFIVITLRDEVEDDDPDKEDTPPYWNFDNAIVRIISARKADAEDQVRYLENGI
jgi:uncharacterized DUF497 family protein